MAHLPTRNPPRRRAPRRRGKLALGVLLAIAVLGPRAARAQPSPSDRALATELFKQGRTLMAAGKHAEACPKLAESQRLDPGGGTLLNLALCHEAEGKTATAWSELNDAIANAQRDGRRDREKLAQEKAAALEPKLSRLTIVVPPEADVEGLAIQRDGTAIGKVAFGSAVPVDPGEHHVQASAPGRTTWSTTVVVGPNADRQSITVPTLEMAAASEPIPATAAPPIETPAPAPPVARPVTTSAPHADALRDTPPSYVPGLIIGGAGAVALGIGVGFGIDAISKKDESDSECVPMCTDAGETLSLDAGRSADVSTVAFIIGGVGLGVGGLLVIRAAMARGEPTVTAGLGPNRASVRVRW